MTGIGKAPLWGWHDKVVCCICAPHYRILTSGDGKFLWRLERHNASHGLGSRQVGQLDRIVGQLDHYASDNGIAWP
jgi:hypothetical protein